MAHSLTQMIKDEAFLIRSIRYGDNHRILSFLTRLHGRVDVIALGASKSQKRFSGILDFIHCLKIEWKKSPRKGLAELLHCELQEPFVSVRGQLDSNMLALGWLALIGKILPEGGEVSGTFDLVYHCLEQASRQNLEDLDCGFRFKLLSNLGYHLHLEKCLTCGATDHDHFHYNPTEGSIFCTSCSPYDSGIQISNDFRKWYEDWIAALPTVARNDTDQLKNFTPVMKKILDASYLSLLDIHG